MSHSKERELWQRLERNEDNWKTVYESYKDLRGTQRRNAMRLMVELEMEHDMIAAMLPEKR